MMRNFLRNNFEQWSNNVSILRQGNAFDFVYGSDEIPYGASERNSARKNASFLESSREAVNLNSEKYVTELSFGKDKGSGFQMPQNLIAADSIQLIRPPEKQSVGMQQYAQTMFVSPSGKAVQPANIPVAASMKPQFFNYMTDSLIQNKTSAAFNDQQLKNDDVGQSEVKNPGSSHTLKPLSPVYLKEPLMQSRLFPASKSSVQVPGETSAPIQLGDSRSLSPQAVPGGSTQQQQYRTPPLTPARNNHTRNDSVKIESRSSPILQDHLKYQNLMRAYAHKNGGKNTEVGLSFPQQISGHFEGKPDV